MRVDSVRISKCERGDRIDSGTIKMRWASLLVGVSVAVVCLMAMLAAQSAQAQTNKVPQNFCPTDRHA